VLSIVFGLIWLASAALFRRAARANPAATSPTPTDHQA
jgi:hypothetical protein